MDDEQLDDMVSDILGYITDKTESIENEEDYDKLIQLLKTEL